MYCQFLQTNSYRITTKLQENKLKIKKFSIREPNTSVCTVQIMFNRVHGPEFYNTLGAVIEFYFMKCQLFIETSCEYSQGHSYGLFNARICVNDT